MHAQMLVRSLPILLVLAGMTAGAEPVFHVGPGGDDGGPGISARA